MSSLLLKVMSSLIGMGALMGIGLYLKNLVAENAVLQNSVAAATEYSLRLVDEVEAYSEAVRVLGNRDQEARDTRDDKFKSIEGRDLKKMSERHSSNLLSILNARTNRMLDSIESSSRSKANKVTSSD